MKPRTALLTAKIFLGLTVFSTIFRAVEISIFASVIFLAILIGGWVVLKTRFPALATPRRLWLPLLLLTILATILTAPRPINSANTVLFHLLGSNPANTSAFVSIALLLMAASALAGLLALPPVPPPSPPPKRRTFPRAEVTIQGRVLTTSQAPSDNAERQPQSPTAGLPKVNLQSATPEEVIAALPAWEKYLFREASAKNDPTFGAAPYPFQRVAAMHRRMGKVFLKENRLPEAWEAYRRLYSVAVWHYRIFEMPKEGSSAHIILMGRLLARSRDLYRFVYTPDKDEFAHGLELIKASDLTALRKLHNQLSPPSTPPKNRPRSRHKAEIEAYEHYAAQGYWGYFVENDLWSSMMLLFFWNEIYNIVPASIKRQLFDALPNRLQDLPPDFFQPGFYSRRKKHIQKRLRTLAKADLAAALDTVYEQNLYKIYTYHPRIYDPAYTHDIAPLQKAARHIPNSALLAIMERLITNFKENRSGFPDLFLVSPKGEPLFVEAKGQKEALKPNQEATHAFLRQQGLTVNVFRLGTPPL